MSKRWLGLLILVVSIASRSVAHAAVVATPNPFDLGSIAVNTAGSGQFSLTDTVSETATLTLATGGDCGQFSILSTLTPALSTTPTSVMVQLLPTSVGMKSCTIAVTSSQPTVTVTVTGTGTGAPQISIDPPGLAIGFGNTEVAHASPTRTVTATNTGNAPLIISSATFSLGAANYTVTGTTTSQTVAPGATAQWDLACRPAVQGSVDGAFRIASNAPGNTVVDVSLACIGTRGFLSADPTLIPFGGVPLNSSRTRTLTLSNTGNLPVSGITAVFDRPTAGYSIDPATPVPTSLAAGATAMLTVIFAPTVPTDGGNAKITFVGDWGAGGLNSTNAQVALTGEIINVGVDPAALDFASFLFDSVPTQVFHIINSGSSAVVIDPPTFVPDTGTTMAEVSVTLVKRGATTVTLPASLPAGQQFDVTVKAAPTNRAGIVSGHFVVHSSTPNIPDQTVMVTGNATAAMITMTNVDFGAVDFDDPAVQTKTAVISNTGTGPLNVTAVSPLGVTGPFTVTGAPGQVAPGGSLTLTITYKPTMTRAASAPDQLALVVSFNGVIGAPPSSTIMVQGRAIDRVFVLGDMPVFPATFRNPGAGAPVRAVTVRNDGEAVLKITKLAITGDPVWTLLDASPVDIAGGASHDFMVRFAPSAIGAAPPAQLTITSNDNARATTVVPLTGNGIARNVVFDAMTVDVGFVGIGVPTSFDVVDVSNRETDAAFTIRSIVIPEGTAVRIEDASDVALAPASTRSFALTVVPTVAGHFETTATLFLDEDPLQQAEVKITGEAVFVDAHGGGGCDAGGARGAGGLAIGLAVMLLARRRRGAPARRRGSSPGLGASSVLGIAVVAVLAAPAARADGVDVTVFEPTPATTTSGFQLQSPEVGAPGSFAVSAILSNASNPLVLEAFDPDGRSLTRDALVERSSLVQLGAAFAFLGRFEVGAHLPLYNQSGQAAGNPQDEFTAPPADGGAVGNLALHGKLRLARASGRAGAFVLGAGATVTVPTATEGQFTGSDEPALRLLVLASVTPSAIASRLAISVNGGPVLRGKTEYANIAQQSGVAWGFGASFRVIDPLWATAEVFGETTPSGKRRQAMSGAMATTEMLSPVEWLLGVRLQAGRQVTLGLAGGRGLTGAIGTPEVRGVLSLAFVPRAARIAPIHPPEVPRPDGDADGDGIRDSVDKCPREAEDLDLFDDGDGCPDPDNDHDGIADAADSCPIDAEDKDGFEDLDGCPDKDNDGDGIPDGKDKCPSEPEDKDGFQDLDGCPDADNDHDGIPDDKDKCPNEAETINGLTDDDGCPDKGDSTILLSPDRIEMLDPVQFTGVKPTRASYALLAQVAATLRAHTEIVRVRITVHVQPGKDPDADQARSEKRAQAVRDWLVQWGIAAIRVEARGFGGSKPLVPPDRRGAAKVNDRLELIILERK